MDRDAVLTLSRSYWECRILLTAAELDLFTLLADESLTRDEIVERTETDPRALTILLDAMVGMGLVVKTSGRYTCAPGVAPVLSSTSPQSVLPMVLHHAGLWRHWSNLTDEVRGREVADDTAEKTRTPEQVRAFIGAMRVVGELGAPGIVDAVGPGSARMLLDVGGASGAYTAAFLRAVPGMKATLFDRPDVIEMAREHLTEAGLLDRVSLVPGDFHTDPLPQGHDLAFISAIIHQNSPQQNLNLYRNTFQALEPGGRIIVRDHIMSPDRTQTADGAAFAVNMLVATQGGDCYTYAEIEEGLTQAGFENVRSVQDDTHMDGLVEARKP